MNTPSALLAAHRTGEISPSLLAAPAPVNDPYERCRRLIAQLRGRTVLSFSLQVDGARHLIEWPVEFSEYRDVTAAPPVPLGCCSRAHLPELELLRRHLEQGDIALLTYFTNSSSRYLQNSEDRMEWFFALDAYVDRPELPPEARPEIVRDLITWLGNRRHRSVFPWVNTLNTLLRALLEELEDDGLDTSGCVRDIRDYYGGLLREFDPGLSLRRYLENRAETIGMRPEFEFCFAYLGKRVPPAARNLVELMKENTAHLVALQNDVLSLSKEERQEQGHLNLKTYFPDDRNYISFVRQAYQDRFAAFQVLRPTRPGPLQDAWHICNQWLCGSLVWHLTSRRYDLGQFEILP